MQIFKRKWRKHSHWIKPLNSSPISVSSSLFLSLYPLPWWCDECALQFTLPKNSIIASLSFPPPAEPSEIINTPSCSAPKFLLLFSWDPSSIALSNTRQQGGFWSSMDEMYGFYSPAGAGDYYYCGGAAEDLTTLPESLLSPPPPPPPPEYPQEGFLYPSGGGGFRDDYPSDFTGYDVFGSDELVSAISEAASINISDRHRHRDHYHGENDEESAVKAKIKSHPSYPRLLQAYIECQKVQIVYIWERACHKTLHTWPVNRSKVLIDVVIDPIYIRGRRIRCRRTCLWRA